MRLTDLVTIIIVLASQSLSYNILGHIFVICIVVCTAILIKPCIFSYCKTVVLL